MIQSLVLGETMSRNAARSQKAKAGQFLPARLCVTSRASDSQLTLSINLLGLLPKSIYHLQPRGNSSSSIDPGFSYRFSRVIIKAVYQSIRY